MIELIKATDIKIVKGMFNINSLENAWIIKNKNRTVVGLIEYKKYDMSIHIKYIDIIPEYRRQKIATKVIEMISKKGEYYICGDCIPVKDAICFWKSLNVEFEHEDFEECTERNECIPFSL